MNPSMSKNHKEIIKISLLIKFPIPLPRNEKSQITSNKDLRLFVCLSLTIRRMFKLILYSIGLN